MAVINGVPTDERDKRGASETFYDIEAEVMKQYEEGAKTVEAGLCCLTEYDTQYLKLIPPGDS